MALEDIQDYTIYKIVNPLGQIYIGKTTNYNRRVKNYSYTTVAGQRLIYDSIKSFGFNNHTFNVIKTVKSTVNYAEGLEMFYIRSNMSNYSRFPQMQGLNLTDGGAGALGSKQSQESIEKTHSKTRGIFKWDEANKKRIGQSKIGNTYNKGKVMSDVEKGKMRLAKSHKSKIIIQFDLDGNFIAEHQSKRYASIITGISRFSINEILNGITQKPKSFIFKYKL